MFHEYNHQFSSCNVFSDNLILRLDKNILRIYITVLADSSRKVVFLFLFRYISNTTLNDRFSKICFISGFLVPVNIRSKIFEKSQI